MWRDAAILLALLTFAETQEIRKIDDSRALFTNEGPLRVTNSYGHLILKYPLSDLKSLVQKLNLIRVQMTHIKITDSWPPEATPRQKERIKQRLRFVGHFINNSVEDVTTRINTILSSVSSPTLPTDPKEYHGLIKNYKVRPKRQIVSGAIALVAGLVGGTMSSLFSTSSLEDIVEQRQQLLSQTVGQNILHLERNEQNIRTLNNSIVRLQKNLLAQVY